MRRAGHPKVEGNAGITALNISRLFCSSRSRLNPGRIQLSCPGSDARNDSLDGLKSPPFEKVSRKDKKRSSENAEAWGRLGTRAVRLLPGRAVPEAALMQRRPLSSRDVRLLSAPKGKEDAKLEI